MTPIFCISWGDAMRQEGTIQLQSRMLCRTTGESLRTKSAHDRIDAGARLATLLLHAKPSQPEEAQAVINKLVEYAPADYRGYLARGRFWLGLAASDQSQKSLESRREKRL